MDDRYGLGVPDSALIALAELILKLAGLKGLFVQNRHHAIKLIHGVKPAPPKTQPLGIKAAVDRPTPCRRCGAPVRYGELCKTTFCRNLDEHINCNLDERINCKTRESLYKKAIESLG